MVDRNRRSLLVAVLLAFGFAGSGLAGFGKAFGAAPASDQVTVLIGTTKAAYGVCQDVERVKGLFEVAETQLNVPGLFINIQEPRIGIERPDDLFQLIRGADVPPDSATLFCYLKLHGFVDPQGRHGMQTDNRELISREDVLNAMLRKKPRLAILITDSCSIASSVEIKRKGTHATKFPRELLLDLLVHAPDGVVDINSSTGVQGNQALHEEAWMDLEGGLFTRSFVKLLSSSLPEEVDQRLARIDSNHNSRYSWDEFFRVVREDTDALFQDFRATVLEQKVTPAGLDFRQKPGGDIRRQQHQYPKAFSALPASP